MRRRPRETRAAAPGWTERTVACRRSSRFHPPCLARSEEYPARCSAAIAAPRSSEVGRDHVAIDPRQFPQFGDRHTLIGLMHRGAYQAELSDRTIVGDEPGVG